jgi:hypothetical protein
LCPGLADPHRAPIGHIEKGNGGPLTGGGYPRNAGAGALAFAAEGFQSSAYALKSRWKKLDLSVLMLSPALAELALGGTPC